MISRAVRKIDEMPDFVPFVINIAIAAFVGLAHGGALVITMIKEPEHLDSIVPTASISLPLAALVMISSIVALIWPAVRARILPYHAIILCAGSVVLFFWAASILINGIPEGNFSWSPGLLSLFCAYPVFLLRRALLSKMIDRSFIVRYAHIIVLVLALVVDTGVFLRAMHEIPLRVQRWEQEIIDKHRQHSGKGRSAARPQTGRNN